MKRLFVLVFVSFGLLSAKAQQTTYQANLQPPRPKVGVVMGGGGARGAAHIGVLKYIEELGIPIDYVAGTSMGSIMGGLYAMGYEPDEMAQLIAQINWSEYIGNKIDRKHTADELRHRSSTTLVNIPFGRDSRLPKSTNSNLMSQLPSAFVNNSSLVNLFNNLCIGYQEDMDFNDLPIPFACVATDLITGEEVVIRDGSVPVAMRASMAIPGVFAPVVMGDKVLVDGGLVNNFPADVLHEMGADIIIGVEITKEQHFTPDDLKSLPQVMTRLLTNTTSAKREDNRKLCDVYIVPDVSGFGMLSFNATAIDTLVNRGYKVAQQYHDQLMGIKQYIDRESNGNASKDLHAPRAKNLGNESVHIRSIEINGVTERESHWLIRKSRLKTGKDFSSEDIERAVNIYRGTGCFDDITYTVKESDSTHHKDSNQLSDTYDLTINMKPAQPHVAGLGFRYDTEEGAALLLNIGLNEKKFGGSKVNLSAKLSYNPRINATYTYSRSSLANFNLAYDYRDEHFGLYTTRNSLTNLHFVQHKMSGYISQFHLLNFNTTVGVSYAASRFDKSSIEDQSLYDTVFFNPNQLITPFVTFVYDNLDDAYFAKHGVYVRLASHLYIEPGITNPLPFDICYAFKGYITPGNGKFTIIPQVYGRSLFNEPFNFNLRNQIGGEIGGRHFEEQLPFIGFSKLWSSNDQSAILRCDLRYNIYGKHYVTAMYNALVEYFNYGEGQYRFENYHGVGLKYSYNSLLGPISLTGQWSNITRSFDAYFSIGYTF